MFDTHNPHPLLAQVPLTVSPFLSIPTAVTLPYTYRSVPNALPPSIVDNGTSEKCKYVISASGHSAHPDDLLRSYTTLSEHMSHEKESAEKQILEWEQAIKDRELAEKRRIAPGWLDRDTRILEPTKPSIPNDESSLLDNGPAENSRQKMPQSREAEELDRVFGSLTVK